MCTAVVRTKEAMAFAEKIFNDDAQYLISLPDLA